MTEFTEKYRSLLRDEERHLSQSAISAYLNMYPDLSQIEQEAVQKHLETCDECTQTFNTVFDEELEFDSKTQEVILPRTENGHDHEYRSSDPDLTITITSRAGDNPTLKIVTITEEFRYSLIRIVVPDSEHVWRIAYPEPGQEYEVPDSTGKPIEVPESMKIGILRTFSPETAVADSQGKVSWRRYAVAAAVLVTIGLGIALLFNRPGLLTDSEQTPPAAGEQGAPADIFLPNPVLENFIDRTVRGDAEFHVVSPQTGETVESPVEFRWEGATAARQYTLTVLSNENTEIWSGTVDTNRFRFSEELKPGLYYWKVTAEGELLGVSKFEVR